ncbi:hypothetical protein R1flu_021969 [Riccia fluitans]|uniref:Chalcone/stilbene synthase N-terminal domain-containing protein n=1 Tax=Riccia fluitans TaxID=41844 RepID=A0ABD1ZSJ6_9MARC
MSSSNYRVHTSGPQGTTRTQLRTGAAPTVSSWSGLGRRLYIKPRNSEWNQQEFPYVYSESVWYREGVSRCCVLAVGLAQELKTVRVILTSISVSRLFTRHSFQQWPLRLLKLLVQLKFSSRPRLAQPSGNWSHHRLAMGKTVPAANDFEHPDFCFTITNSNDKPAHNSKFEPIKDASQEPQSSEVAKDLTENNAGARVLANCSKVTAVTFSASCETHLEGLIGSALFGGGAAAIIVGADPRPGIECPMYEMHLAGEMVLPGSDGAFDGHLS